jgi:hypothetical protein
MNAVYPLFLVLPLLVYFLPGFQTGLEQDVLLLAIAFYLFLRMANFHRQFFPPAVQVVVSFVFFVCLYGIGWMGLWKGYGDVWGRWLVLYPALLAVPLLVRPKQTDSALPVYRHIRLSCIALMLISVFLVFLHYFVVLESSAFTLSFGPMLVLFLVISLCSIHAKPGWPLHTGKQIFPVFVVTLLLALPAWSGNVQAWWDWYRAGEEERAWAPFRYEKAEEIAANQQKPYQAAALYHAVRVHIRDKGFLPRYLNWDFFLGYRMAIQAQRSRNTTLLAQALPLHQAYPPSKMAMVQQLWDRDFLLSLRYTEPSQSEKELFWIDFERHPITETVYGLDCWGRVHQFAPTAYILVWQTEHLLADAVDLEIVGDAFVILCKSGQIYASQNVAFLQETQRVYPYKGEAIDLEIFASGQGALVATTHGEVCPLGAIPKNFPDLKKLYFDRRVIADMEIDLDEQGYYFLDRFGAVHANHKNDQPTLAYTTPKIPQVLIPYWADQSMAIDLELDPLGRGLTIYNRLGEAYTLAPQPYRETYRPPATYPYRGLCIKAGKNKELFAFESNGNMIQLPRDAW